MLSAVKRKPMSAEQRQALSEMMKAKLAALSPEEHAAAVAKFRDPLNSEHTHEQLTKSQKISLFIHPPCQAKKKMI